MNLFKQKVNDQIQIAEQLLLLQDEFDQKKRMLNMLHTLEINESAAYLSEHLSELNLQLKEAQKKFDEKMNDVLQTHRS
ncbi:hypothetical protein [Jeotgalibacillus soli]|uniref:hypothetical protein n=1 Tax=Jeotgalibacillus soli TaxID=889306 RepID=UPI000596FFF5|nr:hypothetical protein [Jeotgalibacillus soli]